MASTAGGMPKRNPKMLELISWLHDNLPLEDSSGSASGLVHGDFRIDNLIFHPNEVLRRKIPMLNMDSCIETFCWWNNCLLIKCYIQGSPGLEYIIKGVDFIGEVLLGD